MSRDQTLQSSRKPRVFRACAVLGALTILVGHPSSAAQNAAPVNGVVITLSATKATFGPTDPILLTLLVSNQGSTTISVGDVCIESVDTKFVATTAAGLPLPGHRPPPICAHSGLPRVPPNNVLPPGAAFSNTFDLRKSYSSLPSGTINVQALRPVGYDASNNLIYAKSNVIQIMVSS